MKNNYTNITHKYNIIKMMSLVCKYGHNLEMPTFLCHRNHMAENCYEPHDVLLSLDFKTIVMLPIDIPFKKYIEINQKFIQNMTKEYSDKQYELDCNQKKINDMLKTYETTLKEYEVLLKEYEHSAKENKDMMKKYVDDLQQSDETIKTYNKTITEYEALIKECKSNVVEVLPKQNMEIIGEIVDTIIVREINKLYEFITDFFIECDISKIAVENIAYIGLIKNIMNINFKEFNTTYFENYKTMKETQIMEMECNLQIEYNMSLAEIQLKHRSEIIEYERKLEFICIENCRLADINRELYLNYHNIDNDAK